MLREEAKDWDTTDGVPYPKSYEKILYSWAEDKHPILENLQVEFLEVSFPEAIPESAFEFENKAARQRDAIRGGSRDFPENDPALAYKPPRSLVDSIRLEPMTTPDETPSAETVADPPSLPPPAAEVATTGRRGEVSRDLPLFEEISPLTRIRTVLVAICLMLVLASIVAVFVRKRSG